MTAGLRGRERLRDDFGRYVKVAEEVMRSG
jgi:hypothetical protein